MGSLAVHAAAPGIDSAGIAALVQQEIGRGDIPGAVVLIGDRERILYRRAFGYRVLSPRRQRMTLDTGFDLASLTKVVATTPAVMQLIEQGKIALDAPVARYWPAFAAHGKSGVTVRELLTHTSGLPPDLSLLGSWRGRPAALRKVVVQRLVARPGRRYIYSDINFIVLGELVRRVSGEGIDIYCERHIFQPLGMRQTEFRPPAALRAGIAPTELVGGRLRQGEVQDPTAARMGGVAGHAGLFATAGDLAQYAQTLLRGGTLASRGARGRLLAPASIRLMTQPDRVASDRFRGLGWDLAAPFVEGRSRLPQYGAFGHLGYTGTSLWIDPARGLFVILLTSRLYPHDRGNAQPLRNGIAALLADEPAPARSLTPASGSALAGTRVDP